MGDGRDEEGLSSRAGASKLAHIFAGAALATVLWTEPERAAVEAVRADRRQREWREGGVHGRSGRVGSERGVERNVGCGSEFGCLWR